MILHDLAWVAKTRRQFRSAEALYLQSLSVLNSNRPTSDRERGVVLNDLATVEMATGKTGLAIAHFEQAIAVNERVRGPFNAELITNYRNYAGALMLAGRVGDAVRAAEHANGIAETAHPHD
ncbi:MAG TPA: tetratricopeptide repeat protein [Tepidisphaeraceae bacterium]|nr:tetratricopeptide repeat protein [Tepidisphaeraceae bacterium]